MKNTVKRIRKVTESEKIFVNHISHEDLLFKIYKGQ